jgi:hypothetical protein
LVRLTLLVCALKDVLAVVKRSGPEHGQDDIFDLQIVLNGMLLSLMAIYVKKNYLLNITQQ